MASEGAPTNNFEAPTTRPPGRVHIVDTVSVSAPFLVLHLVAAVEPE